MAGFGLRLVKSMGMEGTTGNLIEFDIDPDNTNPIFTGDPVLLNGGFVEEVSGGGSTADYAGPVLGVFMGCRYAAADGDYEFKNQWNGQAGASDVRAHIAIPAGALFWVKEAAGSSLPRTAIGNRYGLAYNAGSAAYGDSRFTLGAANVAGGVQLLRPAPLPGNVIGSGETIWEVNVIASQGYAADAA